MLLLQVQPKHVKEAFRLLNKSIIRVEQPDVHLEEEEEQQVDEPMEADENVAPNGQINGNAKWTMVYEIYILFLQ